MVRGAGGLPWINGEREAHIPRARLGDGEASVGVGARVQNDLRRPTIMVRHKPGRWRAPCRPDIRRGRAPCQAGIRRISRRISADPPCQVHRALSIHSHTLAPPPEGMIDGAPLSLRASLG